LSQDGPEALLLNALRALTGATDGAFTQWHDEVARSFRRTYLDPVVANTDTTIKSMQLLSQTIAHARRNVPIE